MFQILWNSDVQLGGGGERWEEQFPVPALKSSLSLAWTLWNSVALSNSVQIPRETEERGSSGSPFLLPNWFKLKVFLPSAGVIFVLCSDNTDMELCPFLLFTHMSMYTHTHTHTLEQDRWVSCRLSMFDWSGDRLQGSTTSHLILNILVVLVRILLRNRGVCVCM